jgi:hypothetical protein
VQGSLGGDSKRRTATYARHVARSPFMLHACNVHCDRARDLIWNGRVCDGKSTVGIEKLEPVRTGPHAIRIHVLGSTSSGLVEMGCRVSGEEDLCVIIVAEPKATHRSRCKMN